MSDGKDLDFGQVLKKSFNKNENAINVVTVGSFVPESFNEIAVTYPTDSSEVYTYKLNSNVVAILTVSYTDSTKEILTSVVRS